MIKPLHIFIFLLVLLGFFAGTLVSKRKSPEVSTEYLLTIDSLTNGISNREKFLQSARDSIKLFQGKVEIAQKSADSLGLKLKANNRWYYKEISKYKNLSPEELENEAEAAYRAFTGNP